jgi:hypothetical protein
MTHPLRTDFWYGWPGVIAAGYIVIGLVSTPEMVLTDRLIGAVGGAFLLVAFYWALYRVWAWVWPSRQSPQPQPESIDD